MRNQYECVKGRVHLGGGEGGRGRLMRAREWAPGLNVANVGGGAQGTADDDPMATASVVPTGSSGHAGFLAEGAVGPGPPGTALPSGGLPPLEAPG